MAASYSEIPQARHLPTWSHQEKMQGEKYIRYFC